MKIQTSLLAMWCALAMCATAGCSEDPETAPADGAPPPRVFDREEERRAVYSVHLRENWIDGDAWRSHDVIVLVEETMTNLSGYELFSEDAEAIEPRAVEAFFATADEVHHITGPLDVTAAVEIHPRDEIWQIWTGGEPFLDGPSPQWDESFPGAKGFLSLTDVGFAPNGRQAILCDGFYVHSENAFGSCYVLDWDDEAGWQTTLVVNQWIA